MIQSLCFSGHAVVNNYLPVEKENEINQCSRQHNMLSSLRMKGFLVMKSVVPGTAAAELHQLLSSAKIWTNQEIALEELDPKSLLCRRAQGFSSMVMEEIAKAIGQECFVPRSWEKVTYVRRKARNEFTTSHKDFEFFRERGYVVSSSDGAYTWWTPISPLLNSNCSRLQLLVPADTPKVNVGDVLLFHQNVVHEATLHRSKAPSFSIDGRFFVKDNAQN
jgi:ectoine hydroxylase-related dioxygenase (phytanoyl-CoA dioxygenase family)